MGHPMFLCNERNHKDKTHIEWLTASLLARSLSSLISATSRIAIGGALVGRGPEVAAVARSRVAAGGAGADAASIADCPGRVSSAACTPSMKPLVVPTFASQCNHDCNGYTQCVLKLCLRCLIRLRIDRIHAQANKYSKQMRRPAWL
jgi:hypothetical protein